MITRSEHGRSIHAVTLETDWLYLKQTIGFTIGFATSLAGEMGMLTSVILVFFFGLAVTTVQTVLVYIPAHRLDERLRVSRGSLFVFPVLGCTGAFESVHASVEVLRVRMVSLYRSVYVCVCVRLRCTSM